MKSWSQLFQPVVDAGSVSGRPVTERPQQAQLGSAIARTLAGRSHLIAEAPTGTGKSLAALIPIIEQAHLKSSFRAVISTETNALQDQYTLKDLPYLQKIYGKFTFCALKGRAHYFCLDRATVHSRGNKDLGPLVKKLEPILGALGTGERGDVEKRVGKLDDETWSMLSGDKIFCNDNDCGTEKCFTMRARAKALASNITVVNHALLQADIDMKDGQNAALVDGLLGNFNTLIVDEAHALEAVLIDGWTEEINGWELMNLAASVSEGLDSSTSVSSAGADLRYRVEKANTDVQFVLDSTQRFFELLHKDEEWSRVSVSLQEQWLAGGTSPDLLRAMTAFEEEMPARVKSVRSTLDDVQKHIGTAIGKAREQQVKGVLREMSKGLRAAKTLSEFCGTLLEASKSRDGAPVLDQNGQAVLGKNGQPLKATAGVVRKFGVPHAVVLDGYESRDGTHRVRIRTVPLDVSEKAKVLWKGRSAVLLSATLTDLTTGTFDYTALSLGFPEHESLKTESVFSYREVQRAYITPARLPIVDTVDRAQYSFEELTDLLNASDGRALVLFTARAEMEDCAERLRELVSTGAFKHQVLVVEKGVDRQVLLDTFKADRHSVLLGSKGLMTGIDVPGDALSLVVLCKFPLPRFDVVCRKQIDHWRKRGYGNWYARESLQTFQQASGRLIRSSGDHGVVAILDQRVTRGTEKVSQTAQIGVRALGSDVIRSTEEVRDFLASR